MTLKRRYVIRRGATAVVALVAIAAGAFAQPVEENCWKNGSSYPPDTTNYLGYLNEYPPILSETAASRAVGLYGSCADPTSCDLDGDGIEDRRQAQLERIARRFMPILRRNTSSIPRKVDRLLEEPGAILRMDVWKSASLPAIRDATYKIRPGEPQSDALLHDLVSRFNPNRPRPRIVQAETDAHRDTVMYFEFPGCGESSWKDVDDARYERDNKPYTYVHFFTNENAVCRVADRAQVRRTAKNVIPEQKTRLDLTVQVAPATVQAPVQTGTAPVQEASCFELVAQYWLFYPFNDGGNNHEGDWEHLNVHISIDSLTAPSLGAATTAGLMTQSELETVLNDSTIVRRLVPTRMDYYFHHYVTSFSYVDAPQLDLYDHDRDAFMANLISVAATNAKVDQRVYELFYDRLHMFDELGIPLNPRPIGYIGGDNQGLDQLLTRIGGRSRDSHGTYPLRGMWKDVGPLGATERINGRPLIQFPMAELAAWGASGGDPTTTYGDGDLRYKDGVDEKVLSDFEFEIVPDWEVAREAILGSKGRDALHRWYWLVLPIRWGFPVSESLFGNMIKEVGNHAPVGPAYNTAWNRVGSTRGYETYHPSRVSYLQARAVQEYFRNELGWTNIHRLLLISTPVVGFIAPRILAASDARQRVYSRYSVPARSQTIAGVWEWAPDGEDFGRLLNEVDLTMDVLGNDIGSGNVVVGPTAYKRGDQTAVRASVGFNIGSGIHSTMEIPMPVYDRYGFVSGTAIDTLTGDRYQMAGDFQMRTISALTRIDIAGFKLLGEWQTSIQLGFSNTNYRILDLTLKPEEGPMRVLHDTDWLRRKWWPNSFHTGAAAEWLLKVFNQARVEWWMGLDFRYLVDIQALRPGRDYNEIIWRHRFGVGLVIATKIP